MVVYFHGIVCVRAVCQVLSLARLHHVSFQNKHNPWFNRFIYALFFFQYIFNVVKK